MELLTHLTNVLNPYKHSIIGIDPGLTTGICILGYRNRSDIDIIYSGQMHYDKRFITLNHLLTNYPRPIVVIEDYRDYGFKDTKGSPIWSARLIGVVEQICYTREIPCDATQMAHRIHSKGKDIIQFLNPEHERAIKAHGKVKHVRDAYSHAVLYALTHSGDLC